MEAPTGFNDFNSQLRAEFSKNEGQASASEPASAPPSAAPATEPPAPATPPAPPAEAAPAPTQADRTYEKLIEARRAARAEQEALKAERAARQLDDASRAELEEYRQLKALAKEDPVYVAEKLGYKKLCVASARKKRSRRRTPRESVKFRTPSPRHPRPTT